jgi:glycosyltransferase involved in cell wall biosynthesis
MSSSDIAVIIPTYMPGSYLYKCLSSLKRQSLQDNRFSIYIGLNGPANPYYDYILNVIEDLGLKAKLFYIEQPGVSRARNYLIENSVEDFIVFIDDDDLVSANYLEALLSVSSKDVIGVSNLLVFEDEIESASPNYIGRAFLRLNGLEENKFKARKYFSSPCAKLINRDIVGDFRFDERFSKGEDALFMTQISKNVRAIRKASGNPVYYVYRRPGSVTQKPTSLAKEVHRVIRLIFVYLIVFFDKEYDQLLVLGKIFASLRMLKKKLLKVR